MEDFYLANLSRYYELVTAQNVALRSLDPVNVKSASKTAAGSEIVVSARIRPLLPEDVSAGFPQATFERKCEESIVDIHDLYNYPWGKPILKVRALSPSTCYHTVERHVILMMC
jgi:kinesin family member 2/24